MIQVVQSRISAYLSLILFLFVSTFSVAAYPVIEAESFNGMSGIQLENNNTTVGYFDAGDWLLYKDVDFGTGPKAIVMNIAKASTGGRLEIRVDGLDGNLIANFYPLSTNSWTVFEKQTCNIGSVSGIHDVYIIASEVAGVCNLDWLTFSDTGIYEPNWVLEWSDEFNGNQLDETVWNKVHHGNPDNGELQFYTPRQENIVVSDGTLKLIARKETYSAQGPWMSEPATRYYTSGKIETQGKLTFQYGKIEARMKLPRGKGTWPAFWMLGENLFDAGVGWPKCGEIDIMEHGQDFDNLGAAIHTESYNHTIGTQKTGTYNIGDYDTDFHTYGVEWSGQKLSFYVDGHYYFTVTKDQIGSNESQWPFDQPFWLILNHAVGGAWGGTPDDMLYPHTTEIDWVRVYKDIPLSVAVNQIDLPSFTLFPNPVDDICWVEMEKIERSVHVVVYAMDGTMIKSFCQSYVSKFQVDLSDLSKGYYVIKIKTKDGCLAKPFLKR